MIMSNALTEALQIMIGQMPTDLPGMEPYRLLAVEPWKKLITMRSVTPRKTLSNGPSQYGRRGGKRHPKYDTPSSFCQT